MIDPGEAARIVERDLHNAEFRVNSASAADRPRGRRAAAPRARPPRKKRAARRCVNFGMLVTATVLEPRPAASSREAAIANLAPTARVSLRPVWGSQDSAFAAALPVGLFLPAHLKSPRVRSAAL